MRKKKKILNNKIVQIQKYFSLWKSITAPSLVKLHRMADKLVSCLHDERAIKLASVNWQEWKNNNNNKLLENFNHKFRHENNYI